MKTSILAAAFSLAAFTSAQFYNISSKPFHLVVQTAKNKTLNGRTLLACHEGAAIEGLCLGDKNVKDAPTYTFNTSVYAGDNPSKYGAEGLLIYTLIAGGDLRVPSPLELSPNVASNVAVPLFTPSDGTLQVAFDKSGLLNIQSYIDDRVYPVGLSTQGYYRWYICETNAGYAYTTLAWVYGEGKPQNPTCQKVDVKRVFKK